MEIKRTFWIVFCIGVVLRVAGMLVATPPWYDESFTLDVACLPWPRMMAAISGDVHPPLWYALEWSLCHIWPGMPYWTIRVPALLFGLLAIWLMLCLLRRLSLPVRVWMAVIIAMSILPTQLWFSTEGRMYTLLECMVLLTVLALLDRRWVWLGVCFAGLAYTQNYGLFYAATVALAGVIIRWQDWKWIALAALAAALAWSPWALVLLGQMDIIHGTYWIMSTTFGTALYMPIQITWLYGLPEGALIPGVILTWALILIGTAVTIRERHAALSWLPGLMIAVPTILAMVISWTWQDIFLGRAFVGIAPFLYILMARPLELIRGRRGWLLAMVFILPVTISATCGYYKSVYWKGDQTRMMIETIRENWQPGDAIYHADDGSMVNLYWALPDYPQYKYPDCAPVRGALSEPTRSALGVPQVPLDQVQAKRIWVLWPMSGLHPPCYEQARRDAVAGRDPFLVIEDSPYIHAVIWLLEEE